MHTLIERVKSYLPAIFVVQLPLPTNFFIVTETQLRTIRIGFGDFGVVGRCGYIIGRTSTRRSANIGDCTFDGYYSYCIGRTRWCSARWLWHICWRCAFHIYHIYDGSFWIWFFRWCRFFLHFFLTRDTLTEVLSADCWQLLRYCSWCYY